MCGPLQLQGCRGGQRLKQKCRCYLDCHHYLSRIDDNTWSSKGKSGQEEKVQHVGYIPPVDHHHHNDDDDDGNDAGDDEDDADDDGDEDNHYEGILCINLNS